MVMKETIRKYASDPEVLAAIEPVLKQKVSEAVKGEVEAAVKAELGDATKQFNDAVNNLGQNLDSVVEAKVSQRLEGIQGEIKKGIGELGKNIDKIVEQKIQTLAKQQTETGAAQAAQPAPAQPQAEQAEQSDNRSRSSSMLESLAPALMQGILGQGNQEKPDSQINQMSQFAEAMGSAMSSMAAPLFNAYASGQQATMNQIMALGKFGVNPFAGENQNEPSGGAAQKPGQK